MMRKTLLLVALLTIANQPFAMPAYNAKFDNTLYDNILRSYVNADGLVDYEGLRASSLTDLQSYLDQLASAKMDTWVYPEKLAFWINAYNAHVIQQVLLRGALKKIDENSGLYDTPLRIANGSYSLNDILHRIIRGRVNKVNEHGPIKGVTLELFDARVHFALARGTLGSPRLRNVAYTPEALETMLREDSITFVNSEKYLRARAGHLHVSSLMQQFAADFEILGGAPNYLSRLIDSARRKDAAVLKKLLLTQYAEATFETNTTVNDIRHAATQRPRLLKAPK